MSFDWREYFNLAQALVQNKAMFHNEAAVRSAVSRAYYAAYCYARNHACKKLGFVITKKSKDHGRLRDFFKSRNQIRIAKDLDELKQHRNRCDYNDTVPHLNDVYGDAVKRTRNIFKRLP